MVRLMPLDDCEEFVADTGESAFDGIIELISLGEDGELTLKGCLGFGSLPTLIASHAR